MKLRHPDRLGLHIRVVLSDGVVLGPGRAELLESIDAHGSISAAGRSIGMSYKRAWDLADATNAQFRLPLIETARGGVAGGGAHLTEAGRTVLALYRRLEQAASAACADELDALTDLIGPS